MAYATGRSKCHAHLRMPFEADDVAAMVQKVFAVCGSMTALTNLRPGITVHLVGGHSRGFQCVRVKDGVASSYSLPIPTCTTISKNAAYTRSSTMARVLEASSSSDTPPHASM
jgi:hypothetical protein